MADLFSGYLNSLNAPATSAAVVSPSDTVPLAQTTRGIWVGGAGNIKVTLADGVSVVLLSGINAGTLLPIRATVIWSSTTTASLIVALW